MAELSDRSVIVVFKYKITTIQVKVSIRADRRFGRACAQDNTKKTSTNNECNSWRNIDKGGNYINQLNEGSYIKLHRGLINKGRSSNLSLFIIDFPTWISQIYSISTRGRGGYPLPHTLWHRSKGRDRSGRNKIDSIICIYFPHFFSIIHTYHEVHA